MPRSHRESHLVARIGWLRASVLGANDGIVSTASLIIGVAAAAQSPSAIVVTGVAALVAGAMSMAAGEYVSVSSQADTEKADRSKEERELAEDPESELEELTRIYMARGLDRKLASDVAAQFTAKDPLKAHLRDELGLSAHMEARPIQAALASAASFVVGAAFPLMLVLILPRSWLVWGIAAGSILFLALLGVIGARAGGAPVLRATIRVTFWGALAMAITAGVGLLFGAVG
ncbi:MAG: VIT family protein [Sphingomonas sp.]|uniref:VIT1/CCC1 transporter family protein n=1 Tax=Sphingomonas sp. TaxID=28214 RepID=UPI0035A84722|nr:VIT family protein [Sphingomonas sp.]